MFMVPVPSPLSVTTIVPESWRLLEPVIVIRLECQAEVDSAEGPHRATIDDEPVLSGLASEAGASIAVAHSIEGSPSEACVRNPFGGL